MRDRSLGDIFVDGYGVLLLGRDPEVHQCRFKNKKGLEIQGLFAFLAEQAGFEPAVGY